jgi:hypothetical protein
MYRIRVALIVGLVATCAMTASACSGTPSVHQTATPTTSSTPTPLPISIPSSISKALLQVPDDSGSQSYSVPATGVADIQVGYTCAANAQGPISVLVIQAGTDAVLFTQNETCMNVVQGFGIHLDAHTGTTGLTIKVSPPAGAQFAISVFEKS